MRGIRFSPLAPNKGLTIATGAMSGLNSALRSYAEFKLKKQQIDATGARNKMMGDYYQSRAQALQRQNMSADMQRVQFAHDYSKYLSDTGNGDAAKSIMKSAQPLVDKLVQNMPAQDAANFRQKIQQEIQQGKPIQELGDYSNLNPNEQKMLTSMYGNETKQSVANTAADARVTSTEQQGENWINRVKEQNKGRLGVADLQGKYKTHSDAMGDTIKELNQTQKALSPNNPFSAQLDPEAKKSLEQRRDSLHDQFIQLSNMDPKQFGKPAAGAQPNSTAPAQAPGPKTLTSDQWQNAQKGDIVVHPDGTKYQSLGDGNFIPTQAPQTAAPATPAPMPAAPAPAPSGG